MDLDRIGNPSTGKLVIAHRPTKLLRNRINSGMTTRRGKGERLGGREIFCDLNYWRDEGALEGLEKDGENIPKD